MVQQDIWSLELNLSDILPSINPDMAQNRILKYHDLEILRSLVKINRTIAFLNHENLYMGIKIFITSSLIKGLVQNLFLQIRNQLNAFVSISHIIYLGYVLIHL